MLLYGSPSTKHWSISATSPGGLLQTRQVLGIAIPLFNFGWKNPEVAESVMPVAWLLTMRTGLRHNETAHLTWSQVDLIEGWIKVGASKTAAGDGRLVPNRRGILVVLKEWRARFPKAQPGHYVFPAEAYSASTSAPGAVHHIDPT